MESVDWLSCLLFPVLKLIILRRRDRDGEKKMLLLLQLIRLSTSAELNRNCIELHSLHFRLYHHPLFCYFFWLSLLRFRADLITFAASFFHLFMFLLPKTRASISSSANFFFLIQHSFFVLLSWIESSYLAHSLRAKSSVEMALSKLTLERTEEDVTVSQSLSSLFVSRCLLILFCLFFFGFQFRGVLRSSVKKKNPICFWQRCRCCPYSPSLPPPSPLLRN